MTKAQVEQLLGKPIIISYTFEGKMNDDFSAYREAIKQLETLGVSYGSMQREAPIGLAYGDVDISKWRNLGEDVRLLDGLMLCDESFRNGTVIIYLAAQPIEVKSA